MEKFTLQETIRFYTERGKWYLKQLLPLTYVTEYTTDGRRVVTVWRMWFGRCFDVREWEVSPRTSGEIA